MKTASSQPKSQSSKAETQVHDTPWKNALDRYFKEGMQLLFPTVYDAINWQQAPEFLDKELQKTLAKGERPKTEADKLVKVQLNTGEEKWLLIHIEVQGSPQKDFAERMFRYNSRIRDRYKKDVISLAVLSDTNKRFRQNTYRYTELGFKMTMHFPICKLLDFEPRREELLVSDNVFGFIVLAQLDAKQIKDPHQRMNAKLNLIRELFRRGLNKEDVIHLFNLIDWFINLPHNLEQAFIDKIEEIEEEQKVEYVNTVERLAMEKGKLEGEQIGILKTRLEDARIMVKEFNLSIQIVAEKLSLPLNQLRDYINQHSVQTKS
jgi:predicted transposase/invertase (TIGR01784 family)